VPRSVLPFDTPLAAVRVGPAGDVSSGDTNAAIDRQSGLLREVDPRPHAVPTTTKSASIVAP
jgi:hypothetical protein